MNVYVPSKGPSDWQQLLAEPDKHWRPGFSAQAVAQCWEAANGVPPEIDTLLGGGTDLLLALPEHKVQIPGKGKPSQCDVFALIRQKNKTVALAVEGKVDEPFGPTVGDWLKRAGTDEQRLKNRHARLAGLSSLLELESEPPSHLHYQLFHRTAAAVVESERFKTDSAAMIVQSFSPVSMWLSEFKEFAEFLRLSPVREGLGSRILRGGRILYVGWVKGDPKFATPSPPNDRELYEKDFSAWTQEQGARLRGHGSRDLDWENLAEEIESLGRSQRNEIENRLAILILHLLKWQFQPGRRSESWRISIGEQRIWIPGIIKHSPSLKSFPETIFAEAYVEGRRQAINETGFAAKIFPTEPPFLVSQALDSKFWPGEPFDFHDVLRD